MTKTGFYSGWVWLGFIRYSKLFLLLPLLGLLSACVNDAASYQINGRDHALTLIRTQQWFWKKSVNLELVAARFPECQRRHAMKPAANRAAPISVYKLGLGTYLIEQGPRLYLAETRTCETFQSLDEEPQSGKGQKMGEFRQDDGGKLRFYPEQK